MRRWAVVAVLGAVVGCGSATETPPVPTIDGPRDATGADPCALPAPEHLTALGLAGEGTPSGAPEGPRCTWGGTDGRAFTLTLYTDGGGVGTLAENSEPTTTRVRVGGYPALETFTGQGEFCQYDVGVAEDQALLVALDAPSPGSCDALQSVIPGLVAALPPRG